MSRESETRAQASRMLAFVDRWYKGTKLQTTSTYRARERDGGTWSHHNGQIRQGTRTAAVDGSGAPGIPWSSTRGRQVMRDFAKWLDDNFRDLLAELIHTTPFSTDNGYYYQDGRRVGFIGEHHNHVHWAVSQANLAKMETRARAKWGTPNSGGGSTPSIMTWEDGKVTPWGKRPTVRRGQSGGIIGMLQFMLRNRLGYKIDRVSGAPFGPQTEAAVKDFQRTRMPWRDSQSGVVDASTWASLEVESSKAIKPEDRPVLLAGVQDEPWTGYAQHCLRKAGYDIDDLKGFPFGPQTEAAVRDFKGRYPWMSDSAQIGRHAWAGLDAVEAGQEPQDPRPDPEPEPNPEPDPTPEDVVPESLTVGEVDARPVLKWTWPGTQYAAHVQVRDPQTSSPVFSATVQQRDTELRLPDELEPGEYDWDVRVARFSKSSGTNRIVVPAPAPPPFDDTARPLFGADIYDFTVNDGFTESNARAIINQGGLKFLNAKVTEVDSTGRNFVHAKALRMLTVARDAGLQFPMGFVVPRSGVSAQTLMDRALDALDQHCPWWRTTPEFSFQVDTEKWDYDPVSLDKGIEVAKYIRDVMKKPVVAVYAPDWGYEGSKGPISKVKAAGFGWWASEYVGSGASRNYKDMYNGAGGANAPGWRVVDGVTPVLNQYCSDGKVPGYSGDLVMTAFKGTEMDFARMLGVV